MLRILAFALLPFLLGAAAPPLTPEARVATVSYHLQTRAADLCSELSPMASFLIADEQNASVSVIVPDGPAAQAGLRAGDVLVAINGKPTAGANVADLIDAALDAGKVSVLLADQRRLSFTERKGCGFAVGVQAENSLDAYADGTSVAVASGVVDFSTTDDELAIIIGHELAHNILKHRDKLDAAHIPRGLLSVLAKNAARIRQTEEDADVMGLYLMARACYDIGKAPVFWERFGARTGMGVFSDGTHPRTRARVALARATIATIRAQQAKGEPLVPHFMPTR